MKFSAVVLSVLSAVLAGVIAMTIHAIFLPDGFYITSRAGFHIALLFAGAQAVFIALPLLAVTDHFKRLNAISSTLIGAVAAAGPWLIAPGQDSEHFGVYLSLAACGAIAGAVGYFVLRRLSPNYSFNRNPLRGSG